jgi:hypothetical protein
MLRLGIGKHDQYLRALNRQRIAGLRVSYELLDVGENPTEEQLQVFEDISFRLRTSNGTYRTTFPNRFDDLDEVAIRWIEKSYSFGTELKVQDRAASHALTSLEWAIKLFRVFPQATLEASDTMFSLIKLSLPGGQTYVVEPDGQPLQYIRWPFVVFLRLRGESWRYPVNRLVAARARRRFDRLSLPQGWMDSSGGPAYQVSKIPLVHPKALQFSKLNPRFQLKPRSVFECLPDSCHALRTMNILNPGYFPPERLIQGINAAFHSLKLGGIWIVGRTLKEDFSNHVTIFQKQQNGWMVLDRLGKGSEIEELALRGLQADLPKA